MKKIKLIKKLMCVCIVAVILTLVGCTDNANYDNAKEESQTQVQLQDRESENQNIEQKLSDEAETAAELASETEMMTDLYGPVEVSDLDYDSFQSRMTDEEWEGFEQYFPVLKENVEFHYTDFGDGVELNKDGEPVKDGEYPLFERYASEEMMDIHHFVELYSENDVWKIEDIRVWYLG